MSEYLITPSLLNAWLYINLCRASVKEAQTDTMCLEDKQDLASEKAYEEFLNVLSRVKSEPNEYMLRGIEFEDETCKGNTIASPIIEGGAFQVVGTKHIQVSDVNFLMYGRLDVLKGGVIYDLKRVSRYTAQKYIHSSQHRFYMDLFPEARKFTYLAFDGARLHEETYYKDECKPTEALISEFVSWLKENNLWGVYVALWASKNSERKTMK